MNRTRMERRLEAKARRVAKQVGLYVQRSRQRAHVPNLDNFGDFMLVDAERNFVVAGSRFDLTADDVIAWVEDFAGRSRK